MAPTAAPRFSDVPENPFVAPMPADFLWGVATSAHQVDGHTHGNDRARFERQPGVIAEGAVSGPAADHWNRLEEDTGLIRELGANAHSLSLEWSRLEPEPGRWDEAASRLGAQVRLWCTVNEQNVEMVSGYGTGQWPPCRPHRRGRASGAG